MGSSGSSSSSTSSSTTPNDPNCYIRNQMIRQQCLRTHSNNESAPYFDKSPPATQQPLTYPMKTHLGCDYQGNVVECDESGRVIRVVKSNTR